MAFNRIPKSRYYSEMAEETKQKWQIKLEKYIKATITKQYFPTV
jgi:RNase P subunit RPR2